MWKVYKFCFGIGFNMCEVGIHGGDGGGGLAIRVFGRIYSSMGSWSESRFVLVSMVEM